MRDSKYSEAYLEWCEIMGKAPNMRDFIIFHAGYNFALLESQDEKRRTR